MKILEILTELRLEVREGWQFQWKCFGENAHAIDLGPYNTLTSIIYDIDTQEVYSMSFIDEIDEPLICYMWINPTYREAYLNEREERLETGDSGDIKEVDISDFEVIVSKHKIMCEEVLTS